MQQPAEHVAAQLVAAQECCTAGRGVGGGDGGVDGVRRQERSGQREGGQQEGGQGAQGAARVRAGRVGEPGGDAAAAVMGGPLSSGRG
ncbi:hypothetical protein [Streptomyces cinnamoneus]|uniref:hypothetical protein n=1 Tax=Streptomyces cinnamoneus TaxID=53446 RepID=UPI001EFD3C19|nr:hypothetical protein [Streptomyces cinnamoneus]